jgi:4-amino-4-deoxy-L-arabinose transferase-like glycosyltransferase
VPQHVVALGLVVAATAAASWWGSVALGPAAGPDAAEHIRYAEYFDQTGHLPSKSVNYEYASPPAFAVAAVYVQRAARWLAVPDGAVVPFVPAPLRRLGWFVALAAAGAVLSSGSARARARLGAVLAASVLLAVAVVAALARAGSVPWSSGQLIALLSGCGLVVVSAVLARRVFPQQRAAPVIAALLTAAFPVVLREAVVFHPELPFALLVGLAVLAVVWGAETEWGTRQAVFAGAFLGAAALTRQTAAIVAVALGVAVLMVGRRAALSFVGVAALTLVLVAGPWWGYQAYRFGNPIQSNLERPGYMLPHGEPRSFYVSFPLHDLVLHPYRNAFANQLLPKFHADLWSDWYGVDRGYWASPSTADRVLASSQSVLGIVCDFAAVAGLALVGMPALARLGRGMRSRPGDVLLATLTLLTLAAWAGFVVTLVRFPQAGGDPIKASYLLFLAPPAALFAVAYGDREWRRARTWRLAILLWSLLYALSYAGVLVTTY